MRKVVLKKTRGKNPIVDKYVRAVKEGEKSRHVLPNGSGWKVKKMMASRASRVFKTKKEAVNYAKVQAEKHKASLFIYGKDGKIQKRYYQ